MNQLLKITEELAAMRAQLEAAKAVKHHIVPAAYKKKSKESSLLEKRGNLQLASRSVRYGSEKLVFAQVDFNNFQKASVSSTPTVSSNGGASITSFAQQRKAAAVQASRQEAIGIISGQSAASSLSKSTANDTAVEDEDYEYDPATDSSVKYMRAPEPDIASPFKGNEEKWMNWTSLILSMRRQPRRWNCTICSNLCRRIRKMPKNIIAIGSFTTNLSKCCEPRINAPCSS